MKRDPNIDEVYQNKIAALRAQLAAKDAEVGRLREAVKQGMYWVRLFTGPDDALAQATLKEMRAALKGEG